jgi:hypothetical protein
MNVPVTTSVAVSDFVGRRYRCYLFYVILAALGASDQGVWGVYGYVFSSFMAVQMTPLVDVSNFGHYNAFTVCCFLNKLFRNKIVKMLNPEFEEEPPFKLS